MANVYIHIRDGLGTSYTTCETSTEKFYKYESISFEYLNSTIKYMSKDYS